MHGICDPIDIFDISVGVYFRCVDQTVQVDVDKDTIRWLTSDWTKFCNAELKYVKSGYARQGEALLRLNQKLNKHIPRKRKVGEVYCVFLSPSSIHF